MTGEAVDNSGFSPEDMAILARGLCLNGDVLKGTVEPLASIADEFVDPRRTTDIYAIAADNAHVDSSQWAGQGQPEIDKV